MSDPFIGQIMPWPIPFEPVGWAFCDGRLLQIQQYSPLFALIGTRYGGNGTTTFALPDLRGRVVLGAGDGPSTSPYNLADTGGAEQVALAATQMPAHSHTSSGIPAYAGAGDPATAPSPAASPARIPGTGMGVYLGSYSSNSNTSLKPGADTGLAGQGQQHENRQPYIALNFIIALEGVWPPRP
jgi:microcystin-dependent protein